MAPNPPWADLHQELLTTIANTLTSDPIDILAFRSVCKSWHASDPAAAATSPILSPSLPLILAPPPESLRHRYSSFTKWCLLSATTVYSLRAPSSQDPLSGSHVWIAFVDQFNKGKVSLRQPLSDKSYSMPIHFPRNVNLLDFHASELGRFYNVTALYRCNDPIVGNIDKPIVWGKEALKVVFLSDISVAVVVSREGKLALLRLGMGDVGSNQVWETIHDGKGYRFDDIVEFKGRVLGVDRRGRVYVIGVGNPSTINMIAPPIASGGARRKRLVVSLGELYLVVRCSNVVDKSSEKNAAFKVYQLSFQGEKVKWRVVTEFDDRVFLFGIGFSLSVSTQELGDCCKKNCIIFKDESFQNYNGDNDDERMFNKLGKKHMLIGVCHMEHSSHIGGIGSFPGYSGLFWPPPSWIWPICRLKRLGGVETAIDGLHIMVPDRLKGRLQEGDDAVNQKNLTQWDQDVLGFARAALKIKEMVNQMKEIDEKLTSTATDFLMSDGSYTRLLNQVQTSNLLTEKKNRCVDMMCTVANKVYDKHIGVDGNLRDIATWFNGVILSFEENTSEIDSFYKKHVQH